MNLLLAFLIVMVVLGLTTDRLSLRTYVLIFGVTLAVTALYYIPRRFMT